MATRRTKEWYDSVAVLLDRAASWHDVAPTLGLSPSAVHHLATRLRKAGYSIGTKGKGGRPSLASIRLRPEAPQWSAVPAGGFRVVSDAEMETILAAGNLFDPFGDGSPLTVLP